MSYFKHHVFVCCNQREDGSPCCNDFGAPDVQAYAKQRIKALGLRGKGQVRINKAGRLDRCDEGPVLVVYPDNVWYTYIDHEDIDEIIEEHLVGGRIVTRLQLGDS